MPLGAAARGLALAAITLVVPGLLTLGARADDLAAQADQAPPAAVYFVLFSILTSAAAAAGWCVFLLMRRLARAAQRGFGAQHG